MALNTRIKNKRDTAANWETADPVLLEGEIIIVTTNAGDIRFKIGDGTKTYTQLPFQDESLYNVLSGKADADDLESLQDVVDGKQDSISGGASTITSSDLTVNRALVSNAFGKVAVSAVTSIELGYLDGVTSGIQNQLDGKANTEHEHSASDVTSGTLSVARGGTGNTSVDTTPTSGSTKMVTSGGVYTALSGKADAADLESIQDALDDKFDKTGGSIDGSITVDTSGSRGLYLDAYGLESRIFKNAFADGTDYGTTIADNYAEDTPARFVLMANGDLSEVVYVIKNNITYKLYGEHNKPTASDITSGTLAVARGGTGQTSITDTTYTTARYRASALYSESNIVNPTTNGVINWAYA